MNNNENILKTTDITSAPMSPTQLQQDYDYFKAQEIAKSMLSYGLISLDEFNNLTLLNRKSFSPIHVEIMEEIT